jgi:hypothetical protein
LAESSIGTVGNRLKHLAEYSDLGDSESVKRFIASKPVANGYKHELAKAYNYYVFCHGMTSRAQAKLIQAGRARKNQILLSGCF